MTTHAGPLFETTFFVADEAQVEFADWVDQVMRSSLDQRGIEAARSYKSDPDDQGQILCTCQFQARDDNALDELLDGFFAAIDADLAAKFGGTVQAESRTLREDSALELPLHENPNCLNCGTRLRGQYCGVCGQRSRGRLISLWQLLREAFGDLLELDSRLWRTLIPLLIKPGQLTRDYLEGRRARYMPPFRTYLVLSVVFFVVAFFDPRDALGWLFEPDPPPTAEETAEQEQLADQRATELARDLEELAADIDDFDVLSDEQRNNLKQRIIAAEGAEDSDFEIDFSDDGELFGDCSKPLEMDEDVPEWIKKRLTAERFKHICEQNKARGNDNLADALLDNIPVALFVLLPLMALVLKILYPLSRRYFVEHLLFFLHFHAFFFLILMLQILFVRLVGSLRLDGPVSTLIIIAAAFYIPVYLYKAMRRVYGQGHLITVIKYIMLACAYAMGATFTMIGAFAFAVISV